MFTNRVITLGWGFLIEGQGGLIEDGKEERRGSRAGEGSDKEGSGGWGANGGDAG